MNFIAVDDEQLALDNLISKLKKTQPQVEIRGFLHPKKALEEIKNGFCPDVAFLDIEMYGMSGVELALHFKEVFSQEKPLFFERRRTKELLACLVDRR